ncbi:polyprenyl synthetase family protein [bacterium]|nr:polyprenyl synthetase family protein [bacterium]
MKAPELNRDILSLIEDRLIRLLEPGKPASLFEPMAYLVKAGGKRIRPLLLSLSCACVGGRMEDAIDAAAAVELLHTFTLVHDDIMDHDDLRRGRPTVHRKWDEATAILAGDGLVTLAYLSLIQTRKRLPEVLDVFTAALLELCKGQALDKEFESRSEVSQAEYVDMIDQKTGMLLRASCVIGGLIGSGNPAQVKALEDFGRTLGRAFQIQDDLLDLESEESVFGKPQGSDLVARKKTSISIHFLTHAEPAAKTAFRKLLDSAVLDRHSIAEARNLFENAGTFREVRTWVNSLVDEAVRYTDLLKDNPARDSLRRLAHQIQDRVS